MTLGLLRIGKIAVLWLLPAAMLQAEGDPATIDPRPLLEQFEALQGREDRRDSELDPALGMVGLEALVRGLSSLSAGGDGARPEVDPAMLGIGAVLKALSSLEPPGDANRTEMPAFGQRDGVAQQLKVARQCDKPADENRQLESMLIRLMNQADPMTLSSAGSVWPVMSLVKNFLNIPAPHDACMVRVLLLMQASIEVLQGRFAAGSRTIAELLPPGEGSESLIELLVRAVYAASLVPQRRYEEADSLLGVARPALKARLGSNHPLSLTLDGLDADIALARAESALAERRSDRSGALEKSVEIGRSMRKRIQKTLGDEHELTCTAQMAEAHALLLAGRSRDVLDVVGTGAPASGTCAEPRDSDRRWLRSSGALYRGLASLDLEDWSAADAGLDLALKLQREVRGASHPETIKAQRALAELRARQGRTDEAVALLQPLVSTLRTWLGNELRLLPGGDSRWRFAGVQAGNQQSALLVALAAPDHAPAQAMAAESILRFRGIQAEEDAELARLVRFGASLELRALGSHVSQLRSDLAAAWRTGSYLIRGSRQTTASMEHELDKAESALKRESERFRRAQELAAVNLGAVQSALAAPDRTPEVLVEYRRLALRELGRLARGDEPEHWVAAVVTAGRARIVDLGPAGEIDPLAGVMATYGKVTDKGVVPLDAASAAKFSSQLYSLLVEPLGLPDRGRVVLVPEGELSLINFPALRKKDGSLWVANTDLRIELADSGRILARRGSPRSEREPGHGLAAVGAVTYSGAPGRESSGSDSSLWAALPATEIEVADIQRSFEQAEQQPVHVWRGREATEERLKHLPVKPRALHLATHAFYGSGSEPLDTDSIGRPLVRSGIVLAGASDPPDPARAEDGILHAIEVQGLDLGGVELVALSACSSAQGLIERGEGIHGLVRAFRIAGAQYVLAAVRPVRDSAAQEFMSRFYDSWLNDDSADPPEAYARTLRSLLAKPVPPDRAADWTAFTLVRNY